MVLGYTHTYSSTGLCISPVFICNLVVVNRCVFFNLMKRQEFLKLLNPSNLLKLLNFVSS